MNVSDTQHAPALNILVVEDNDSLREATVNLLRSFGHQACGIVCAEDMDDAPAHSLPDLYLIDINLPGENGFELAKRIRQSQTLAGIILLTARGSLDDRLQGYGSGADVYLIKPLEPAELLACINSLARRIKSSSSLAIDGLWLNTNTLLLGGPSANISLSHGECLLLIALSRAASNTLERWQVMQIIDPNDKGLLPANMEMRISALRKKLKACGALGDPIRSLRGFGYTLTCKIKLL